MTKEVEKLSDEEETEMTKEVENVEEATEMSKEVEKLENVEEETRCQFFLMSLNGFQPQRYQG